MPGPPAPALSLSSLHLTAIYHHPKTPLNTSDRCLVKGCQFIVNPALPSPPHTSSNEALVNLPFHFYPSPIALLPLALSEQKCILLHSICLGTRVPPHIGALHHLFTEAANGVGTRSHARWLSAFDCCFRLRGY